MYRDSNESLSLRRRCFRRYCHHRHHRHDRPNRRHRHRWMAYLLSRLVQLPRLWMMQSPKLIWLLLIYWDWPEFRFFASSSSPLSFFSFSKLFFVLKRSLRLSNCQSVFTIVWVRMGNKNMYTILLHSTIEGRRKRRWRRRRWRSRKWRRRRRRRRRRMKRSHNVLNSGACQPEWWTKIFQSV